MCEVLKYITAKDHLSSVFVLCVKCRPPESESYEQKCQGPKICIDWCQTKSKYQLHTLCAVNVQLLSIPTHKIFKTMCEKHETAVGIHTNDDWVVRKICFRWICRYIFDGGMEIFFRFKINRVSLRILWRFSKPRSRNSFWDLRFGFVRNIQNDNFNKILFFSQSQCILFLKQNIWLHLRGSTVLRVFIFNFFSVEVWNWFSVRRHAAQTSLSTFRNAYIVLGIVAIDVSVVIKT